MVAGMSTLDQWAAAVSWTYAGLVVGRIGTAELCLRIERFGASGSGAPSICLHDGRGAHHAGGHTLFADGCRPAYDLGVHPGIRAFCV
jgi:hypothetical protein